MKINKNKLLDYSQYLKETLDPWKLKQGIKSFNRLPDEVITIYGDLKELSKQLTDELTNVELPFNKVINFGGIELDVKVNQSTRYYSNVDWMKFLKGDYTLLVEVKPNYDINYVVSTIIHEIRHMIDFTDENLNSGLSSFDIDRNLRKYNIDVFNDFFKLVYISLEHELVARNNQIYPYIKFKDLKKEESLEILKSSFIWCALDMLNEFNYKDFVDKFDESVLIGITNSFIKDCLYDGETTIDNRDELLSFYKTWDEYFREVSIKWKDILLSEFDRVYERITFNIEMSNDYRDIIKQIWTKIK